MSGIPLLFFEGNCREAFDFYKKAFGNYLSDQWYITYRDIPAALEHINPDLAGWAIDYSASPDKIFYAELTFNDGKIALADSGRKNDQFRKSFSIELLSDDVEKAKELYDNLVEHGSPQKIWGKVFWAEGFGIVQDKFEFEWRVTGPLIDPADWGKGA